jgi:hypothetical protein
MDYIPSVKREFSVFGNALSTESLVFYNKYSLSVPNTIVLNVCVKLHVNMSQSIIPCARKAVRLIGL